MGGFLSLSLTAAGCQHSTHTAGDPLMGPVTPPGINGQQLPATTKANAENPNSPSVPAAQTNNTTNNTAAGLANNTQLPNSRPLNIGENQGGGPWQLTNIGKDNTNKTPTVVPVPRDPQPGPGGLQPSSWTDSAPTPEASLAALKSRGAVGEQQERVPGGIHFTCYVPSRTNPNNFRQYEVTGPDLASAVQAILRQIDSQN